MQKDEIKEGDVVQLISGGPRMTVGPRSGGECWWCSWFDTNGSYQQQGIHFASIKKVD